MDSFWLHCAHRPVGGHAPCELVQGASEKMEWFHRAIKLKSFLSDAPCTRRLQTLPLRLQNSTKYYWNLQNSSKAKCTVWWGKERFSSIWCNNCCTILQKLASQCRSPSNSEEPGKMSKPIRRIWRWKHWLRNRESPLHTRLSHQWFSHVWTDEGAPKKFQID